MDNAREENPQGIVNFVLRCCANALLGAFDYLNKFTINFAAITGESYCTSAKMTYELLRRNLLSAVFVETVSTRILTGIVFVLSAAYAVAVSIRQLVHLLTNQTFELLILVCYVVKKTDMGCSERSEQLGCGFVLGGFSGVALTDCGLGFLCTCS